MNILGIFCISLSLEIGLSLENQQMIYTDGGAFKHRFSDNYYYALFEVNATIGDHAYIKGSLMNIFGKDLLNYGFIPYSDTYTIEAGARFKGFVIGINHACYHPIIVYAPIQSLRYSLFQQLEGYTSTVFLRFEIGGKSE